MELDHIRQHWQNWARSFGKDLRATTKGRTAKMVECAAIGRVIAQAAKESGRALRVLEIGCGNGFNCSWIATTFPETTVTGIDYIADMIEAAEQRRSDDGIDPARLHYAIDNALELSNIEGSFDVVFTNRCIINLNTPALQCQAIQQLCRRVAPGGYAMLIENSRTQRLRQDRLRAAVDLPSRPIDAFNTFIEDGAIEEVLGAEGFDIVTSETISSLHDVVLYILLPMINGGRIEYDHPIVEAAARLNIEMNATGDDSLGSIGQNRNVVGRRRR